ncbi:hypothetical protein Tco_1112243 [Tanacetum coccineum]|uniref:Zinc finger, CCHC-type n=1 Tax=Tanacetum coccineum TaxID=301880 RepID=A0ABQ5INX1_9ASTR
MDESIYVYSIINKLLPSCKDFKHTLKHNKDELSLVQLGSHLRIEETLRAEESDQIGETPIEIPITRSSNRSTVAKSFRSDFQLYLVERSRDEIRPLYSYWYSIEDDPRTFDEAMQSHDVAFWKEAINDEMDSIIENNT